MLKRGHVLGYAGQVPRGMQGDVQGVMPGAVQGVEKLISTLPV